MTDRELRIGYDIHAWQKILKDYTKIYDANVAKLKELQEKLRELTTAIQSGNRIEEIADITTLNIAVSNVQAVVDDLSNHIVEAKQMLEAKQNEIGRDIWEEARQYIKNREEKGKANQ